MHRQLYFCGRWAPVTTIKWAICICANVSLRGITVYSAGWGIFRKPCFCNYSGCSNGPSNVPRREHVSQPKRDRERECENAFIFESEVFRRLAFFEFLKIDQINVSKKRWCRAKSSIFRVSFLVNNGRKKTSSRDFTVLKRMAHPFHSAETTDVPECIFWTELKVSQDSANRIDGF